MSLCEGSGADQPLRSDSLIARLSMRLGMVNRGCFVMRYAGQGFNLVCSKNGCVGLAIVLYLLGAFAAADFAVPTVVV